MRITLLHNPAAGFGSPTRAELMAWLAEAGYEVTYQSTREADFSRALDDAGDLIVVAGGDGTVARVIRGLAGRATRVAIVPLGTANNIALSLGVQGTPRQIVERLPHARPQALDVATATAAWATARFVESAGLGLFASVLRDAAHDEAISNRDAGVKDLVSGPGDRMRRMLRQETPVPRQIVADGVDLSGEYLFVAVFNTPFIGPRLELAPRADPADGQLDLLAVGESERVALDDYLADITDDSTGSFPLPTRRCRQVRMQWDRGSGHLDDAEWPDPRHALDPEPTNQGVVTIEIQTPPVQVMVGDV